MTNYSSELVTGVAPGAGYDATLELLYPWLLDETEKRAVVTKIEEEVKP